MRERFEYAAAWFVLKTLGALPRPVSRALGVGVIGLLFLLRPRLWKTAMVNLRLAFPEWTAAQRRAVTRRLVRNIGRMAAEFALFPRWTRENVEQTVLLDGHENFLAGRSRGKGVLFLTGHFGAWEISSFAHALYGFPLHYMARPIDNARVDALING